MTEPWGHKIRVSIYVDVGLEEAGRITDDVIYLLHEIDANFIGVSIEEVQDEPNDQIAT